MQQQSQLDLELFRSKVRQPDFIFSKTEVVFLQKVTQSMSMPNPIMKLVNEANAIWQIINEKQKLYWENIMAIVLQTDSQFQKVLCFQSISNNISKNWNQMESNIKQGLQTYIITQIKNYTTSEIGSLEQNTLSVINQVLVQILKYEWNKLFNDFISNFAESIREMNQFEIANNFQIIRLCMVQGFESWQTQMTCSETQNFKNTLAQKMRVVLKIIELCLTDKRGENIRVIEKTIEVLSVLINFIPLFDMFNCNLIEILQGFIGFGNHKCSFFLNLCFERLFGLHENLQRPEFHTKIANKLLHLLSALLNEHQLINSVEKSSYSTEDSQKNAKKSIQSPKFNKSMLLFLHIYLQKYSISIKSKSKNDGFEIQFDKQEQITLSKQFYSQFSQIFIKIVSYINLYIEHMHSCIYICLDSEQEDQEQQQVQLIRIFEVVNYLFSLLNKIGLKVNHREMSRLVKNVIFYLTPYDNVLKDYYLLQKTLPISDMSHKYYLNFQPQVYTIFKEIIHQILLNSQLQRLYILILNKSIEQTSQFGLSLSFNDTSHTNIQKDEIEYHLNCINRIAWNLVILSQVNKLFFDNLSVHQIATSFAKSVVHTTHIRLKRCFSMNSKYILISTPASPYIRQFLVKYCVSSNNQQNIIFILLILSKIIVQHGFNPSTIKLEDLEELITKLFDIMEKNDCFEVIFPVYSAVFAYLNHFFKNNKNRELLISARDVVQLLLETSLSYIEEEVKKRQHTNIRPYRQISFEAAKYQEIGNYLKELSQSQYFQQFKSFIMISNCFFKYLRRLAIVIQTIFAECLNLNEQECRRICNYDQNFINLKQQYTNLTIMICELSTIIEKFQKQKNVQERKSNNVNYINKINSILFQLFQMQEENRSESYFKFLIHNYETIIESQTVQSKKDFNKQLIGFAQFMENKLNEQLQNELYELKIMYFKFLLTIIKKYFNILDDQNQNYILRKTISICHIDIAESVEIGIEMLESIFEKAENDILENKSKVWQYHLEFIQHSFQLLFGFAATKQDFFEKIAKILFLQIMIAAKTKANFTVHQIQKGNSEILYDYLHNLILENQNIKIENSAQENLLFSQFYCQKSELDFNKKIKDYVIYIKRLLKNK